MKILLKGIKRPQSGYEPEWMKKVMEENRFDQEFEVTGFAVLVDQSPKLEHDMSGCTDWPKDGAK